MNTKQIILTGITPTGMPHLGNYLGAFKPALSYQMQENIEALYFVADGHSLIKLWDPKLRAQYILEVAATWLALGLDPDKVIFYRQSDVPETFELAWILTSVTAKGLMNRAHGYKDQVAKNAESGEADPDHGITMGLFSYPILMSADILLFNPHHIPVGKDQIQHIEMARDIAARFNHLYGDTFRLPEAKMDADTATLPGLDGRKMSKSYQNTIPLFVDSVQLRKLVMKIKTNSLMPGQPKDPEGCTLFSIYKSLASPEQISVLAEAYQNGIAWGEAKQLLFEFLDTYLAPAREKFAYYMSHPAEVDAILQKGAARAREKAIPFLQEIKAKAGFNFR
ncbi:MAG: tryptophan--tRNA ligase [Gammaproteobacteria bacterium]|nr:tryptophan--tRNA ligase [Gammaproteobacteria bacterium]